jgi:hypothetical protein
MRGKISATECGNVDTSPELHRVGKKRTSRRVVPSQLSTLSTHRGSHPSPSDIMCIPETTQTCAARGSGAALARVAPAVSFAVVAPPKRFDADDKEARCASRASRTPTERRARRSRAPKRSRTTRTDVPRATRPIRTPRVSPRVARARVSGGERGGVCSTLRRFDASRAAEPDPRAAR